MYLRSRATGKPKLTGEKTMLSERQCSLVSKASSTVRDRKHFNCELGSAFKTSNKLCAGNSAVFSWIKMSGCLYRSACSHVKNTIVEWLKNLSWVPGLAQGQQVLPEPSIHTLSRCCGSLRGLMKQ